MVRYCFGSFELDPAARVLRREGQPVAVTAKIFELLLALLENRNRVMNKDELLAKLWPETSVEEANLAQSISVLRRALADNPKEHRYIVTIPGRGYGFVAPVSCQPVSNGLIPQSDAATVPRSLPSKELPPPASSRPKSRLQRPTTYLAFGLGLMIFATNLVIYLRFQKTPPQSAFYSSAPLTNYVGREICPSFSPDGERVAFAWDGPKRDSFAIYVKQIGVGPLLRLTSDAKPDISPAWSPDGRTIAFLHMVDDSKAEVSLIPAIGPAPRRVLATVNVGNDFYYHFRFLAWSPDGKRLAVSDGTHALGVSSLFLLSTETRQKKRITFPPVDYDDFDPAFSPDMRHLAFVRYSSIGASASDLYLLELSGDFLPQGEPERLTAYNGHVTSPAWTPDGRTILFTRHEGIGSHNLWRINLATPREIQPLSIAADSSSALTLSRSGDRLVYTRDSSRSNIAGVELNLAGNHRKVSTRPWIASTSDEDNPQFSPDGQRIAYQSELSGRSEIWTCDRDGSNNRQLTNLGAVVSGFPRWSPDGRKIVFHSRPNGSAILYVIDAKGGTPKRLTNEMGNDISPSWSRDGKWIYFASRRTGELCIWKIPADGGPPTQLTKESGFSPLESKDGQYLYYTTLPHHALRRLPLAGGPDKEILPSVAGEGSSYAPAENGIYFISAATSRKEQELCFFSFTSGQIKKIVALTGRASIGLTLSPDARQILFGQIDQEDSDLMLVDQFR